MLKIVLNEFINRSHNWVAGEDGGHIMCMKSAMSLKGDTKALWLGLE